MLWICLAVLFTIFLILFVYSILTAPTTQMSGAHVLITGGSSGIGKSLAIEAANRGANITLIARNQARLREAKEEVEKSLKDGSKQCITYFSVDVTKDPHALEEAVKQAEKKLGVVNILINCAGTSSSAKFIDTPPEEFHRLMDVNYYGSVLVTKAVVPSLVNQRKGHIVFVSSMGGQLGLFGYTAYSASKFALRGLAESLQMELKPYNIQVTMAFPPDTDTPGFAEEQKMKPKETRLVSESGGLFSPQTVARTILDDMMKGKFLSSIGLDGYMLSCLTSGFSPVTSAIDAVQQVALMGIFRLVSVFYLMHFDRVVRKCKDEAEAGTGDASKDKKTS
ncbi:hypothetical protein BaRGS_00033916 [Batillaria attramentaria]|uniref:3-dehydrosphinganine reductase n=1 Tax=Batillaria attramentaria TaxID=370345 RepID=A0ABD0JIU3_9CAEN